MAFGGNVTMSTTMDTNCPICLEDMRSQEQRALNCLHTFCKSCLKSLVLHKRYQNSIQCPTCRKETILPEGGIDGLPANFYFKQMNDIMTNLCQNCNAMASVKCLDCEMVLCEYCNHSHVLKNHETVNLKPKKQCEVHQKDSKHICLSCQVYVCVKCISSDAHKDHQDEIVGDDEAVHRSLEIIKGIYENELKPEHNHYQQFKKAALKNKEQLKLTENKIKEHAEMMKNKIDKQSENLLSKLSQKNEETDKLIQNHRKLCDSISYFHEASLLSLANRPMGTEEIFKIVSDAKKLSKTVKSQPEKLLTYASFKPQNLSDDIGELELKASNLCITQPIDDIVPFVPNIIPGSLSKAKCLIKNVTIAEGCQPVCIAVLPDCSAVVADKTKSYVSRISLHGEQVEIYGAGKSGVTSVFANGCSIVYSYEDTVKMITSYAPAGLGTTIEVGSNVTAVALMDDDTIVLSTEGSNDIYQVYLDTESGQHHISTLCTCTDNPKYLNCSKLGDDLSSSLIITTTWNVLIYDRHNHCTINIVPPGIFQPCATAVTEKGTILIADKGNHCVVEVDRWGGVLGYVLQKEDGLRYPCGLAYSWPYLWITECENDKEDGHSAVALYQLH